jgi:hypothetical protein
MTHLYPEKRYIPIVPSLPNGLKDAFQPSNITPIAAAHPRQKGMLSCAVLAGQSIYNYATCFLSSCLPAEPLPMRRCVELLLQSVHYVNDAIL